MIYFRKVINILKFNLIVEAIMTIFYEFGGKLYANITNKCPCACVFCIRKNGDSVGGNDSLWLSHEPDIEEIISAYEAFDKTGMVEVVALCDVDMGAKHTQKVMAMYPQAKLFRDFRKLFDEAGNLFDAVAIATPDHSHFPISMLALASGKHVYVEKPLARTFYEAELLMEAALENGGRDNISVVILRDGEAAQAVELVRGEYEAGAHFLQELLLQGLHGFDQLRGHVLVVGLDVGQAVGAGGIRPEISCLTHIIVLVSACRCLFFLHHGQWHGIQKRVGLSDQSLECHPVFRRSE